MSRSGGVDTRGLSDRSIELTYVAQQPAYLGRYDVVCLVVMAIMNAFEGDRVHTHSYGLCCTTIHDATSLASNASDRVSAIPCKSVPINPEQDAFWHTNLEPQIPAQTPLTLGSVIMEGERRRQHAADMTIVRVYRCSDQKCSACGLLTCPHTHD